MQYLHSISKKKLGMEFIFCIQININVSTNWHYHFWWKWPDISKVPKIESSKCFCNIVRKKYCNCFCVLLWYKKLDIFHGPINVCYLRYFYFLWLDIEFRSFYGLRNSKYIKQTDQDNFSCFFLLIWIKTEANKEKK